VGVREVFISHSAREPDAGPCGGSGAAMEILTGVRDGLAARGFKPLVDQDDIPAGKEWHPEIVHWLARCDAAVVLLNDKALKSDYVRREVNILMWRRALGAPLVVVPVLLDGLPTSAVRDAGMGELRPIQFVRGAQGPEGDPDAVVREVLDSFAELPPTAEDDPMSEWLDHVATYLEGAQGARTLEKVARALQVAPEYLPNATTREGGCLFLAHQFLVAPPERMEEAVNKLSHAMQQEFLERLINTVSFTWVDERAARRLLPEPDEPPQARTVLLNTPNSHVAQQYVQRATCGDTYRYQVETLGTLPTGENRARAWARSWEDAVWGQFFGADAEDADADGDWARVLPSDHASRTHFAIINRPKASDADFAEAVAELHATFSWLIVLVTTGTRPPEAQWVDTFSNGVLLEPLLTSQVESTVAARNTRLSKLCQSPVRVHQEFS